MVNRAAGEIYKTSSILAQTFGETVATAFGLVFYQKSDGKLYRALANAAATVAGKLFVCLDAATAKDRPGNVLAQGLVEKTGWSWAVGGLVYVSPTSPGGLTQTVPTGTQKVRPVGFATKSDQIDFRPMWGTGATYSINFADIPADPGDILVRSLTGWGAESNVPAHRSSRACGTVSSGSRTPRTRSGDPPGLGPEVRVRRIHAGESQRDRVRRVLDR